MKLIVERGQKVQRGKPRFSVYLKIEMSAEESRALEYYGLPVFMIGQTSSWRGVTLAEARSGIGVEVDKFDEAAAIYQQVVASFSYLSSWLKERRDFRGTTEFSG